MDVIKHLLKGLITLVFILILLYVAGMVWVLIMGSNAPEGLQWFYQWIGGVSK